MAGSLRGFVSAARAAFRARAALVAEAIVLRHQVAVLQRSGTRRPRFHASDRLFWALLSRWWSGWRKHLVIVQPATVLRWRRQGLSLIWGYRSRGRWRGGRPRIARAIRGLIAGRARDNFLWGAPRIHGELLKLGFSVSQATVSRYMPDPRWRRSQSWRTFIRNQAAGIGLSELTGGRSVSDFIETKARSWLRVVARRIVGFISDRFANCSQQPAWPRALSERRRNGPMSPGQLRPPLGQQHRRSRGAALTCKQPTVPERAWLERVRRHITSGRRHCEGHWVRAFLPSGQIYAAMPDRLTTNAANCRRWSPPVQLQFHAKPFGPSFEDRQPYMRDNPYLIFRIVIGDAMRRGEIEDGDLDFKTSLVIGAVIQATDSRILGRLDGSLEVYADQTATLCTRLLLSQADSAGRFCPRTANGLA